MRVSLRWLNRVTGSDLPVEKVLETLTMAGLEVESFTDLGLSSGRIVTGRILTREQHPNADNLSLCDVAAGGEQPYRIVCGAKNMQPGDLVPLALEGATLPNGLTIKKSKIRGEASQGMMCSGRELGLTEDHDGLLILPAADDPDTNYREGEPFDALVEIKVTPNRPDCLSVYGIARDMAAMLDLPQPQRPGTDGPIPGDTHATGFNVTVEAPDACPRYLGRVIRDVKIGPSPLWLRRTLEASGLRSINNVVDVTNFVLLELGQPLHAFDLDKLAGPEIRVRYAGEGEKVTTLDEQELALESTDLVITDAEKPVALAGIMGCGNSEINEATTNIFLECGYFTPTVVRKTSKRLGKSTDSSYRFERGIDWSALDAAIERATALILQVAGGTVSGGSTFIQGPESAPTIQLKARKANQLLGLKLTDDDIARKLRALGFGVESHGDGNFVVKPPAHRPDVTGDADLMEELVRVTGYGSVPALLPHVPARPAFISAEAATTNSLRKLFSEAGFFEAYNYSFEPADTARKLGLADLPQVELANPLSGEFAVMRSSLLGGLLRSVAYNHNRGENDVRLFEIGRIFTPAGDKGVHEEWAFAAVMTGAIGATGWRAVGRALDFFDARAVAETILKAFGFGQAEPSHPDGVPEAVSLHPGRSAIFQHKSAPVMVVGQLHPAVKQEFGLKRDAYVIMGRFADLGVSKSTGLTPAGTIAPAPVFPSVTRDLALVADKQIPASDVAAVIEKRAKSLLADLKLFDVYEGDKIPEDKRSLAYALQFNAPDRTLTDDEVNQVIEKVLADLKAKLGVEIRS